MKKAKKRAKSKTSSKRRAKSKTSSKRVAAKSKTRKQTTTKRPTKSKKSILPNTSKLKRVAKDAAVHDSQELDGLLGKGNTCNDVFADSAYTESH